MPTSAPGISINKRAGRGFTLIEILVVVVVVVVMMAVIGLRIGGDEQRRLRDEAQRLALLVGAARQEAMLQGQVLALTVLPNGYFFQRLKDDGKFEDITTDDLLRARELPPAMSVARALVEGAEPRNPRVVLFPTGEMQSFSLELAQGEARWRVEGRVNGDTAVARVGER